MTKITVFLALCAGTVLGCGASTAQPAADTGPDAHSGDALVDSAATDATAEGGDAGCDLGTPPGGTVAPFTASEFIQLEADAGTVVPVPTGGDVVGDFRVTKLTIYLAPSAKGVVDPAKSGAEGVGWFSFTAKDFRSSTDTKITLETSLVGTVKRGILTRGKGAWVLEGVQIKLSPICGETTSDTPTRELGWSRVDADHARIFLPPPTGSAAGFTQASILELERIK